MKRKVKVIRENTVMIFQELVNEYLKQKWDLHSTHVAIVDGKELFYAVMTYTIELASPEKEMD